MSDVGLTHVAFLVADLGASIAFYAKYAPMEVVNRSRDGRSEVAWMSDKTRPFVVVLVQVPKLVPRPLRLFVKVVFPFEHLGGVRDARRRGRAVSARDPEGCLRLGPKDSGPPLGYWSLLGDPSGTRWSCPTGRRWVSRSNARRRARSVPSRRVRENP